MKPLWDFRVQAGRLPNGRYRVTITSASGTVLTSEGYHPLWELIRMLGRRKP